MSNIQDIIETVYKDKLVSLDWHGEQCLRVPDLAQKENEAAWQQAISDATLDGDKFVHASVSEENQEPEIFDDGQSLTRVERIIVQCTRDEGARNSQNVLIGGIKDPNLNLGFVRLDSKRDPLGQPYLFVRIHQNTSSVLWRLTFERKIQGIRGVEV